MRAILHLCREYGQPPSWWGTLTQSEQAILLADLDERSRKATRR